MSELNKQFERLSSDFRIVDDYNSRILSTVYFSIGSSLTLFAILYGAGWVSNYWGARKDFSKLEVQIEREVRRAIAEASAAFSKRFESQLNSLEAEIKNEKKMQAKVTDYFDARFELLAAQNWQDKKVLANAVYSYCWALKRFVDHDYWEAKGTLQRLLELCRSHDISTVKIDAGRLESCLTIVESAQEQNPVLGAKVLEHIKKMEVSH